MKKCPDCNTEKNINDFNKKRYQENPFFRLKSLLRSRIKSVFGDKGVTKGKKSIEALGCTYEEAYKYLEKTLPIGYSMKDIGVSLHIDHINPLGLANCAEQLYMLSHYTNLHLLTIEDHMEKTKKDIIKIRELKGTLGEAA